MNVGQGILTVVSKINNNNEQQCCQRHRSLFGCHITNCDVAPVFRMDEMKGEEGQVDSPGPVTAHVRLWVQAIVWRSYQCPPNSCRNPVIPVESSGIKFCRKACYFFSFWCLLFQQNLGILELRPECSAEFTGTECNGIQLFVCLFHTCYQTNHQPNTM